MAVNQLTFASFLPPQLSAKAEAGGAGKAKPSPRASEVIVNPSVPRTDERRLKRQAAAIYNHLKVKPIWTNQLILIAKQYNARLKEIRTFLAPHGSTVDIIIEGKGKDAGNNCYAIRPMIGSKYQAKRMKRQKLTANEHR